MATISSRCSSASTEHPEHGATLCCRRVDALLDDVQSDAAFAELGAEGRRAVLRAHGRPASWSRRATGTPAATEAPDDRPGAIVRAYTGIGSRRAPA